MNWNPENPVFMVHFKDYIFCALKWLKLWNLIHVMEQKKKTLVQTERFSTKKIFTDNLHLYLHMKIRMKINKLVFKEF